MKRKNKIILGQKEVVEKQKLVDKNTKKYLTHCSVKKFQPLLTSEKTHKTKF